MTQTLDVHQGVSQRNPAPTMAAPTAATAEISRAGIFAITFGISFMLLYTVFERLNWPFFTSTRRSASSISGCSGRAAAKARRCIGMAGLSVPA